MLSDEVQAAILARSDWKPKKVRDRIHFRCPRHEDREPSAWQGGGAWGCFSCGFQEPITSLAQELGILLDGSASGYTIEAYADDKGFSVDALRSWGLTTSTYRGDDVVRIPYLDEDGNELRARFRSRTGKWWEGRNLPIYLYGRDRLVDAHAGSRVLVVEGESDCHALWSDGILAVGVPGATAWREEWAEHLHGLEVYVWEEPDQGGAQMVERLVGSFPQARIIRPEGTKDAADLRKKLGGKFPRRIQAMMDEARPYGAPEPAVAFDVLSADRFERLLEHQLAPIDAVPTPFPLWNRACRDEGGGHGLARGWHVLAAARTGTGKSILALNLAAEAMRHGETVCFVSLEMSQRQVETRLMAIMSGVPIARLEKGSTFDRSEFRRAAAEYQRKAVGRFLTNRSPLYRISEVVQSIRAIHESHGARYFVVDYLQLAANPNDPESITEVSHAVRQQARDLEVITLGLSQFNRSTSTLAESPTVHGLMGGSSLENDADQIVLIDHSKIQPMIKPGTIDQIGWTSDLLLAKNRHGPAGIVPMAFSSSSLQMRELMPDEFASEQRNGAAP